MLSGQPKQSIKHRNKKKTKIAVKALRSHKRVLFLGLVAYYVQPKNLFHSDVFTELLF